MEQHGFNETSGPQQVPVRFGSREIYLDEAIAPLIQEIINAGLEVNEATQDDGNGMMRIDLATVDDLVNFLNIVTEYEQGPDTLYSRMIKRLGGGTKPGWVFDFSLYDVALNEPREGEEGEESHEGIPNIVIFCSVQFPPCDLPVLLERLRHYNAARAREEIDEDPDNPAAP